MSLTKSEALNILTTLPPKKDSDAVKVKSTVLGSYSFYVRLDICLERGPLKVDFEVRSSMEESFDNTYTVYVDDIEATSVTFNNLNISSLHKFRSGLVDLGLETLAKEIKEDYISMEKEAELIASKFEYETHVKLSSNFNNLPEGKQRLLKLKSGLRSTSFPCNPFGLLTKMVTRDELLKEIKLLEDELK